MTTKTDLIQILKSFIYGSQGAQLQQKAGTHELLTEDTGLGKALREELRHELKIMDEYGTLNQAVRVIAEPQITKNFVTEKNTDGCYTTGTLAADGLHLVDHEVIWQPTRYGRLVGFFKWGENPGVGVIETFGWGSFDDYGFVGLSLTSDLSLRCRDEYGNYTNVVVPWIADYAISKHYWRILWRPYRVDLSIDGVLVATIRDNIPRETRPIYAGTVGALGEIIIEYFEWQSQDGGIFNDEEQVFTDEAIRDANAHNSAVAPTFLFQDKTIIAVNTLDQPVSLQAQGSRNAAFTNPINIGDPFTLTAGNVTTQRTYRFIYSFWAYLRVIATAGGVPTVNNLNVWIEKHGGY